MVYEYDDSFVVDSIDVTELERYETQAISEVAKLNIADQDFIDRLSKLRTYMIACRSQYESDGMSDKYKVYKDEYDMGMREAVLSAKNAEGISSGETVWNVQVGRS